MLPNKKYLTLDSVEVAVFPTSMLSISQAMGMGRSHKKSFAIDLVGNEKEVIWAYAPFDCTVKWIDDTINNGILFQSNNEVWIADEQKTFVHFVLSNMDDINDYQIGQQFKQGDPIYRSPQNGTKGEMHIDLKVALGQYIEGENPIEPSFKNPEVCMYPAKLHLKIKNQIEPYRVFWINDTQRIKDSKYDWKEYNNIL